MPSVISAGTTAGTAIAIAGDTTGNLAFQTNGTTTAMTINTSQGVSVLNCLGVGNATPSTSGAGITFPATQSASTDANTLDDYEEGTWTPTAPVGISISTATYQKIGRNVFLNTFIIIDSNSNNTTFIITGLPFVLDSGSSSVGAFNNKAEDLYAYMDGNGIYIRTNTNFSRTCSQLTTNFVAFQIQYRATS